MKMDEEEAKKKAEEDAAQKAKEATEDDNDKGDKYETTPVIERARQEREKMDASTAAQKIENDRTEAIMAKRALGGETEAGQGQMKPVKKSDDEYANEFMKGEVNPLKDDGFI